MAPTADQNAAGVAETVRDYLHDLQPGGVTLAVIEDGVRRIDNWWRVPVRPSAEPSHTFEYYDALAGVEEELSERAHLKVLLVPALRE